MLSAILALSILNLVAVIPTDTNLHFDGLADALIFIGPFDFSDSEAVNYKAEVTSEDFAEKGLVFASASHPKPKIVLIRGRQSAQNIKVVFAKFDREATLHSRPQSAPKRTVAAPSRMLRLITFTGYDFTNRVNVSERTSRSLAGILYKNRDPYVSETSIDNFAFRNIDVSSGLIPSSFTSDSNGSQGRTICIPRQYQGYEYEDCTNPDQYCGIERIVPHVLRGSVNRLCGSVHSLLGDKVFYLPLFGFFLLAIAGVAGGIALNNFNLKRIQRVFGWSVLAALTPVGFFCLLLGLP